MHSVEKTVYAQLSTLAWAACGAPSLKIFTISQVFRVTIIPYQQGLQWFEKNIQSMMYKKLICMYVPLGGITS